MIRALMLRRRQFGRISIRRIRTPMLRRRQLGCICVRRVRATSVLRAIQLRHI